MGEITIGIIIGAAFGIIVGVLFAAMVMATALDDRQPGGDEP